MSIIFSLIENFAILTNYPYIFCSCPRAQSKAEIKCIPVRKKNHTGSCLKLKRKNVEYRFN